MQPTEHSEIARDPQSPVPYPLPTLPPGCPLDIELVRDAWEIRYSRLIKVIGAMIFVAVFSIVPLLSIEAQETNSLNGTGVPEQSSTLLSLLPLFLMLSFLAFVRWFFWKLVLWRVLGDGIEVGPMQYAQVYRGIKEAADRLGLITIPRAIVIQGHGNFHLMVEKRLARRGLIVITSNVMDALAKRESSRELMMLVGTQLGHIKAGHYRFWILKHALAKYLGFMYLAWWRRCQYTADKVGLLLTGDLAAAENAMYIMTVGAGIAPGTNADQILEQRARLMESTWASLTLLFSSTPFTVDRLVRLRRFAKALAQQPATSGLGVIPIEYLPLRSRPILIVHGHDKVARLELENFLFGKMPFVAPRVMINEATAALTIPEKFDLVSADLVGAIALLTPDDIAGSATPGQSAPQFRARQNVILEIGWIWARLGRKRCLLLVSGDIEVPSDLSGAEIHRFRYQPTECSEVIRGFIESLTAA